MTQSNIRGAQCDRVRKTLVRYLSQVCLDSQDPPMVQSAGLGFRPKTFAATPTEYMIYERIRDEFLQEHDHATVALASGGILWRLCIDYLEVQSAFRGPISEPQHQASVVINGQLHVRDRLVQHEEDLICGVYKLCMSKC